ncbi:MAG: hypothetical protein JST31_12355 [Actinobacteria bacterium]|nr:hypothetical protein [Actinomycetota bacterium]
MTLTNVSKRSMQLRFLPQPADGPFGHGHSTCSAGLAPHESCWVTVWFRPTHWGPATGRLVYALDGSSSNAFQIRLIGEAHQPPL